MIGYRNRLNRDVERWQQAGWLTPEGAKAIRAEAAAEAEASPWQFGLAGALGILGAVLIGFAAMSFVAANWQSMSKLARLLVLFAGLWGSYGAAAYLFRRGLFRRGLWAFGHAAVLAGVAIFGASIMLIAQMYHIEGNPPDAVLVWTLGALFAGVMARSNPALAAAMLLAAFWSGWETALSGHQVHWAFVPVWALIAAAFFWFRWRPGFHLAALAISYWILTLGFVINNGHAHWIAAGIGIAVAFGAALGGPAIDRLAPISKATVGYGIGVGFGGLFALQFIDKPDVGGLLALAILTLALLVIAIFWGWMNENSAALWLGYIGFSIEILALYAKTLGTLLGTSLFFLIAGLIVIALAWAALQLHKRQGEHEEASS